MTCPGDDDFGTIGPPEEGMLFRPIRPKSSGKSSHKHKVPKQPDGQIIEPAAPKPPLPPPKPPKPVAPPIAEAPKPVPPKPATLPKAAAITGPMPVITPADLGKAIPAAKAPPPAAKSPAPPPAPAKPATPTAAAPKPVPPKPAPPKPAAPSPPGGDVLGRVPFATAEAVAWRAPLEKPARALLAEGMTPLQYLETLMQNGHFADAVYFLAQAMPKTEAIIWGHTCLRQVLIEPAKPVADTVAAVGRWIMDRNDTNRRACKAAAAHDDVGAGNVAGALAMAVFWSGGSIAPPGAKSIAPKEDLCGKAVGTSLFLASVQTEPHKSPDKLKTFALQGIQFASGKPDEA